MAKKVKPEPEPKAPKGKRKDAKDRKDAKEATPEAGPPKPQRGLAIGDNFGWTGKLPATLLIEHCQKQKWNKVGFDMKKTPKGFVGIVNLSWLNPKTKEVIHLRWMPDQELLPPRETTNEARHFAATYAMHRLNYVKNLKMVLPSIFRDYWLAMEQRRLEVLKLDKTAHDRVYNANPFQVHLDGVALRAQKEKERQARENSQAKVRQPTANISVVGAKPASTLQARKPKVAIKLYPIGRKAWENAPFVDFPPEVRARLELAIKDHISWVEHDSDSSRPVPLAQESAQWLAQLGLLGFREFHAQEALSHTGLFVDALEWLLFHVPEDDLPPFFARRDEDSSVTLKVLVDIQTEYLVARLALSGFDKDELMAAYELNGRHEHRTCVYLTHKTAGFEHPALALPQDQEPDLAEWLMELEGIELIGTNKVEFLDDAHTVCRVLLNVAGLPANVLWAKFIYTPPYPAVVPGIQLQVDPSFQMANYIKLSAVRQLLEYLVDQNIAGECLLYLAVEWLETNIKSVIANPGPLAPAPRKRRVASQDARHTGSRKKHAAQTADIERIRTNYLAGQKLPALRQSVAQRQKLPAWQKRQQLVDIITAHHVTLVTGETGSGKSTQIVQFVLDHLSAQGDFASTIVCTQPRRISTIGLAERISQERVQPVGKETGYVIRGENKTLPETRLLFVTTGVLLRMLQTHLAGDAPLPMFERLRYVFIDEVHERSVDSDFLLILLKRIAAKLPHLRIVLMSATIDTLVFMRFFDSTVNHIHIEGRTFPITDHYLGEILDATDFRVETNDGLVKPRADSHFFKTGTINYDLIAALCVHVDTTLAAERNAGSVLVFLPGIMEISRAIRKIELAFASKGRLCWCLPLHSALSSKDQTRVFASSKSGRKIVVSTNIAETSITIPDCVAVVDSGRAKSMFFSADANTSRLMENWCSQAEMAQRRGRAGRIQQGTCYHLYTEETRQAALAQPVPEIRRTRLENLYLVVKSMGVGSVESFLNSGLDPPEKQSLAKARAALGELGAIVVDGRHEHLTHLGKYLSFIPTDLHAGKLLILGCIFGCVEVCLTLALIASTGSPFLTSFDVKDEVKAAKARFGKNHGDLVAAAAAYHAWEALGGLEKRKFVSENFLLYLSLQDIQLNRVQYLLTLKELGFVPYNWREAAGDVASENMAVVCALITGSFTPQIARVQLPDPKYAQTFSGAVEIDPDARLTKFWIRNEKYIDQVSSGLGQTDEKPATRAFVHPLSLVFSPQDTAAPNLEDLTLEDGTLDMKKAREQYAQTQVRLGAGALHKAPFVVYTGLHHTTKLYLRDLTPTSTVGAVLFGGDISYDVLSHVALGRTCPGIVLDRWMPIRTWCKNGVLLKRLRLLLDQVIENKLSRPGASNAADDEVLAIIAKVLRQR